MKYLFVTFLIINSTHLFGQTVIVQTGPNSAETEQGWKNADNFNTKILDALKNNDLNKAYYYIDTWVNWGSPDTRLYMRFAEYFIAKGEIAAARRKYMGAYKKFGCYECKELADKLNQ